MRIALRLQRFGVLRPRIMRPRKPFQMRRTCEVQRILRPSARPRIMRPRKPFQMRRTYEVQRILRPCAPAHHAPAGAIPPKIGLIGLSRFEL